MPWPWIALACLCTATERGTPPAAPASAPQLDQGQPEPEESDTPRQPPEPEEGDAPRQPSEPEEGPTPQPPAQSPASEPQRREGPPRAPPPPPPGESPQRPYFPRPSQEGAGGEITPPEPEPLEPEGLPAEGCSCAELTLSARDTGVVWRGPPPGPSAELVARLVAPVLWFSPDEPFLVEGVRIPAPLPCDAPSGTPVVYYQLVDLFLRSEAAAKEAAELRKVPIRDIEGAMLRFFFYYPRDVGFDGHVHDLESADFYLTVEELGEQCYQVRLDSVVGHAHGVEWYYNELTVMPDARRPITILVEEGKHASCPDRDADGYYAPGYDVNNRINDAWGIRDILGSSFLGGSAHYDSFMTKLRDPRDRVFPPEPPVPRREPVCGSSLYGVEDSLGSYALRPATEVPQCSGAPHAEQLRELVASNRFGAAYPPQTKAVSRLQWLFAPGGAKSFWPSVSARWDRRLGVAVVMRGLAVQTVYVVPKVNVSFQGEVSIEALITPTASRIFSTYLSVGGAREKFDGEFDWNYVTEAGLRFRFRAPGWVRIITFGHHFGGFRFGVRASGFDYLKRGRIVVELGGGIW